MTLISPGRSTPNSPGENQTPRCFLLASAKQLLTQVCRSAEHSFKSNPGWQFWTPVGGAVDLLFQQLQVWKNNSQCLLQFSLPLRHNLGLKTTCEFHHSHNYMYIPKANTWLFNRGQLQESATISQHFLNKAFLKILSLKMHPIEVSNSVFHMKNHAEIAI